MPLLDRNGWKADAFSRDEGDAAAEAVIVPFEALEAALAAGTNRRLGVDVPNDLHPGRLLPFQDRLDLIAVAFPKFSDGRGFSLARMLREQGFRGILRASGRLVPDQFGFALHCGYDEVELDEAQAARLPAEQWLHSPSLFGDSYQDTADGMVSIFKRRRQAAAKAAA